MNDRRSSLASAVPAPGRSPLARVAAVILVVAVAFSLAVAPLAQAGPADPNGAAGDDGDATTSAFDALSSPSYQITLITGDVVTLIARADGDYDVDIEPHPRADGATPLVSTTVDEASGAVHVLPADAQELVSTGALDPLLFDVTYLAVNGYDDATRAELPVIIQQGTHVAQRHGPSQRPATTTRSQLESIDAIGADVDKAAASELWATLTSSAPGPQAQGSALSTGVERVWLDRKVRVELNESVDQVGAPAAWDLDLDGSGVSVAVIDTGYDPDHPDIADRVIASQSFVEGESVVDGHGHGTHVASILAGTGDEFRGVAPGADLIIGKALSDAGSGDISQVIEAMEWAVLEQGADIVNLSLGSEPTDGTDPGSQAVDALTEAGALFVISAGNDGPGSFTVSSPGAATSALTVGAVDGNGAMAGFSSRGPRVGDHAIKPEIAAPGVSITAARADGTAMGTPLDDHYTSASGTSMAAPHVSGAAAILAQQDPDRTPAELKAALVSASSDAGHTVFEQGAGTLDVARAIEQQVRVSPSTVDFGFFEWPLEGEPTTRTLTYTNPGEDELTLEFSAEVTNTGGEQLPDDGLVLSDSEVVVPAGGSADVTVTLDHTVADRGIHSGRIEAAGPDGLVLASPLGFAVEEEQFQLGVNVGERHDVDTFEIVSVQLFGVDGTEAGQSDAINCLSGCPDGRAVFEVPEGVYQTLAWVRWFDEEGDRHFGVLLAPEVQVTHGTEVLLDAETVEPISFETPLPHEPEIGGPFSIFRSTTDGEQRNISVLFSSVSSDWWVTPTDPVTTGEFWTASPWLLRGPEADGVPEYVYNVKAYEDGYVPESLHYVFEADDLASVDNHIHADQPDTAFSLNLVQRRPGEFAGGGVAVNLVGPTSLREYVGPLSSDSLHIRTLNTQPAQGLFPTAVATESFAEPDHRDINWNARPIVPGAIELPEHPVEEFTPSFPTSLCVGCRQGEAFYPFLHHTSSEASHTHGRAGIPFGDAEMSLYRDGQVVEPAAPYLGAFITYELPSEPADYTLTHSELGAETVWEFSSSAVTDDETPHGFRCPESLFQDSEVPCRAERLIFLRYDAPVDLANTVAAPGMHRLEIDAYHHGPDGPDIDGLNLWYSGDGGERWSRVPNVRRSGDGTFTANVVVGSRDTSVSLRAEAWDADGNTVEQTVLDAYGLRGRGGPPGR